jgi:predicted nucleic acid-binding protein
MSLFGRCEEFRQQKIDIGKFDLRIAAVVLEQKATLVTRNLTDFAFG